MKKEFRSPVTPPMAMGLHFEDLVLGSTATDDALPPLPTTSTGKETIDVKRMWQQAKRVSELVRNIEEFGYKLSDTQKIVHYEPAPGAEIRGVIDFMAINAEGKECMFDLKLTKDLSNTYGDYAWGNVENMDLFQQVVYQLAWEQETGTELAENNLLVVDYSPELRIKLFKLNITDFARDQARDRILGTMNVIEHYEANGFSVDPSEKECGKCPLSCSSRFEKPLYEIEEIDV